jgi:hypothetical protein
VSARFALEQLAVVCEVGAFMASAYDRNFRQVTHIKMAYELLKGV